MSGYTKRALISFCIIALVAGASFAYAASPLIRSISWTYQEPAVISISVSPETNIDLGTIEGPTTKTQTFTVTNTGNVPCNVAVSATVTGAVTFSFDKATATIPVSGTAMFTITLEISGVGTCNVAFTPSAAT